MSIKSVCVYCGSASRVGEIYKKTAHDVGVALARKGLRVIYGGGHVGLMGTVADAALAAGGKVTGIIPDHIRTHEIQHSGLTELFVVDNMHVRKSMMAEKADAFVILPGGFGTLDELFEIMTWKQIGLHTKPIIIYNVGHFWDPLIDLVEHVIITNFAPENNRRIFSLVESTDELLDALNHNNHEIYNPEEKWK